MFGPEGDSYTRVSQGSRQNVSCKFHETRQVGRTGKSTKSFTHGTGKDARNESYQMAETKWQTLNTQP